MTQPRPMSAPPATRPHPLPGAPPMHPLMAQCSAGPQQRAYLAEAVMPSVAAALTAVLSAEDRPTNPVHAVAAYLKRHNPRRSNHDAADVSVPLLLHGTRLLPDLVATPCAPQRDAIAAVKASRCGPHPVVGFELPPLREVGRAVEHLVDGGARRIVWIVASVADTPLYVDGVPRRGRLTPDQWRQLSAEAAPPPNTATAVAVDDAVAGAAMRAVDDTSLMVTLARATAAGGPRYPTADSDVLSAVEALDQACAGVDTQLPVSFHRLQHPDDAAAPAVLYDVVTAACDEVASHPSAVLAVVAVGRWPLVQQCLTTATMYFTALAELQRLRRLARSAVPGTKVQTLAKDVEAEVNGRRRERDEKREWVLKAKGQAVEHNPDEYMAFVRRRDSMELRREKRRAQVDAARRAVAAKQQQTAATLVQAQVRSFLVARRFKSVLAEHRRRLAEDSMALDNLALPPDTDTGPVDRRRERHRDGAYPIVDRVLAALNDAYGDEHVTLGQPPRPQTKSFVQWQVQHRAVKHEGEETGVASEDEEWDHAETERVLADFDSAPFNPLLDVRRAMRTAHAPDLALLTDLHENYDGIASLQRRALGFAERLAVNAVYAVYVVFHLKRRLQDHMDRENDHCAPVTNLLRLPTSLPSGAGTFTHFASQHPVVGDTLAHAAWLMPHITRQHPALHPHAAHHVLAGYGTTDGAYPMPHTADRTVPGGILRRLHPAAPVFLAGEHVTVVVWADVLRDVVQASSAARVLWVDTRPDPVVYVNGVPLVLAPRPELLPHDSSLPPFRNVGLANVNGSRPPTLRDRSANTSRRASGHSGSTANIPAVAMSSLTGPLSPAAASAATVTTPGPKGHRMSFLMRQGQGRTTSPRASKLSRLVLPWLGVVLEEQEKELAADVVAALEAAPGTPGTLPLYYHNDAAFAVDDPAMLELSLPLRPGPARNHRVATVPSPQESLQVTPRVEAQATPRPTPRPGMAESFRPDREVSGSFASASLLSQPPAAGTARTTVSRLTLSKRRSTGSVHMAHTASSPETPVASSPVRTSRHVELPHDDDVMLRRHEVQAVRPPKVLTKTQREVVDALEAAGVSFDASSLSGAVAAASAGGQSPKASVATVLRSSVAPGHSPTTATAGGRQSSMRKPTVAPRSTISRHSAALPAMVEEAIDDPQFLHLPRHAAEAVMTPDQAADDARATLRRTANVDVGLTFLRLPVPRCFSVDWLRFVDSLYRLGVQGMEDPQQAAVFAVSSPECVLHALLALTAWSVEHGGPEGIVAASDSEGDTDPPSAHDVSLPLPQDMASSASSGGPDLPRPVSPWAVLQRLAEQHPRLNISASVSFVDSLLEQTDTAKVVTARIAAEMAAAEDEAAKLSPTANTARDREAVTFHASRAACALERYVLLVLFHSFAASVPEKRELMSMAAAEFTFTEYLAAAPGVLAALDTVDPWEGQDTPCPLPPSSAALYKDYRWRERLWVSSIG